MAFNQLETSLGTMNKKGKIKKKEDEENSFNFPAKKRKKCKNRLPAGARFLFFVFPSLCFIITQVRAKFGFYRREFWSER